MRTMITANNSRLDMTVRRFIDRQIQSGLSRFNGSIDLVILRVGERSEPDDGIHRTCSVTVRLRCGCQTSAEGSSPSIFAASAVAIDRAAAGLGREVRRHDTVDADVPLAV